MMKRLKTPGPPVGSTDSPAIEIVLATGKRLRCTGDFVYVRKCVNDHPRDAKGDVLIWLPQNNYDGNPMGGGAWAEVIGYGPRCKHVGAWAVGGRVLMPEAVNGMFRLGRMTEDVNGKLVDNDDFCIREPELMENFPAILET